MTTRCSLLGAQIKSNRRVKSSVANQFFKVMGPTSKSSNQGALTENRKRHAMKSKIGIPEMKI